MQLSETITASGCEVLQKSSSVHSNHGDNRSSELMTLVTEIATEQGLDNQNYQCKGCGRNIGGSLFSLVKIIVAVINIKGE